MIKSMKVSVAFLFIYVVPRRFMNEEHEGPTSNPIHIKMTKKANEVQIEVANKATKANKVVTEPSKKGKKAASTNVAVDVSNKAKKAEVAKKSKNRGPPKPEVQSSSQQDVPKKKIYVRCRGRRLVSMIKELNDRQIEAVRSIGFGGLLDLNLTQYPMSAVPVFLAAFNDGTQMFHASTNKEFIVTKHDVHDVFCLPLGPKALELVPTGRRKCSEEEEVCFKTLKQHWREKYGVSNVGDAIPIHKVLDELVQAKDGGDEFKRLFVLFSMSTFLCPTSNNGLDMKLLKAVDDVSGIGDYDWCSYVLDGVVKAGLESVTNPTFVLGCIPFLMITYFHRFDFKGVSLPDELPLIKHWDDENMDVRAKAELRCGSLGQAPWSKRPYPICLHLTREDSRKIESPLTVEFNSPPRLLINYKKTNSNKLRKFIQIELPEGLEDDDELHSRAADGLHEMYLQLQRNSVVFHSWYSEITEKIKRISSQGVGQSDGLFSQSTQGFWNDTALHQYVDEVVQIAKQMRSSVSKAPVFLGASTSNDQARSVVDTVLSDLRGIEDGVECNIVGAGKHHPYMMHSSRPLGCMVVVQENLGCSLDCGAPDADLTVWSDVMVQNKEIFSTVLTLRKEVMDYVFITSPRLKKIESLVQYNDVYFITREEMQTLEPTQQLSNIVIDCWSIFMNNLTQSNTASLPSSRCFFNLSHSAFVRTMWNAKRDGKAYPDNPEVFAAWDLWLLTFPCVDIGADMVFIPSLSDQQDHYSVACINFRSEKIEYLDNRDYGEDFHLTPYVGIARITADMMGRYMISKGMSRGSKVPDFEIVNVKFRWQGVGSSNNDCGVYVMLHMLLYCGALFECRLGDGDAMKLFRGEIASTLILSDINKERQAVLNSATTFKKSLTHSVYLSELQELAAKEAEVTLLQLKKKKGNKRKIKQTLVSSKGKKSRTINTDNTTNLEVSEPLPDALRVVCETPPVTNLVVSEDNPSNTTPVSLPVTPSSATLSAVNSRPRGRGDGLGCSLNLGPTEGNLIVVSQFLRNNQRLIMELPTLRKNVADYCFLDDYGYPERHTLGQYGPDAYICRDDIMSMLPDRKMYSDVMESWSMLLNRLQLEDNQLKMGYFGVRHSDSVISLMEDEDSNTPNTKALDSLNRHWNEYMMRTRAKINLESDYIFIPLNLDSHYFCICINFPSSAVDVLDHQTYSAWETTDVYKASTIMRNAFSDFAENRGVPGAESVTNFPLRQVKLGWQSSAKNDEESGCFAMMAMLLYEGSPLSHADLERKIGRRFLVVQLAATLLLADINMNRKAVLKEVEMFAADKNKIWDDVKSKRAIKKILNKQK